MQNSRTYESLHYKMEIEKRKSRNSFISKDKYENRQNCEQCEISDGQTIPKFPNFWNFDSFRNLKNSENLLIFQVVKF